MMKIVKIALSSAALLFAVGITTQAQAADGAELYKTKTCWSCHGKDANTPIMPIYPKLAGQNADYAFNQMMDIKSGARSNGQTAAMKGVMGLVSEEEMRAIADWLSTQ
ncbi:MAG: cytochrome c [Candidatus Thiodiazotropha endolucinida]